MNINELYSNQQLDEISLSQIGQSIGRGLGAAGQTVGAIAGVPQGLGRAVKRGYGSAVNTIGGGLGTQSNAEAPTATGMINPETGRAYVPSDFDEPAMPAMAAPAARGAAPGIGGVAGAANAGAARTTAEIQQAIRNLDAAYRQQMRQLQSELASAGNQSTDDFTQAQKDYMAAIGTDTPQSSAARAAQPAAQPTAARAAQQLPQEFLTTLQAIPTDKLATIKRLLQARAREATAEAINWGAVKKGAGTAVRGIGTGLKKAGQLAAAAPGALATGAGAVAGTWGGMKQAYSKGKQAGQKYVGGGSMSMDDLQMAISRFSPAQAQQALAFIKQIETMQKQPKAKPAQPAAPAYAPTGSAATAMPLTPYQVPTKTVPRATTQPIARPAAKTPTQQAKAPTQQAKRPAKRPAKRRAMAESLTWGKNWDPSEILIRKL